MDIDEPAAATFSSAPTTGNTINIKISAKELSECDRQQIHLLGHVQGGAGHVLFLSYPKGEIVAADADIRNLPWIRQRGTHTGKRRDSAGGSSMSPSAASSQASSQAVANITPRKRDLDELLVESKARDLLGSYLQFWVPYGLYLEIFEAVEGMKKAKSTRTFHFYKHKTNSYALTLSTTSWDCSIVSIEIEVVDGKEATSDFYSTLVSLGRIMEFYAKNCCTTSNISSSSRCKPSTVVIGCNNQG